MGGLQVNNLTVERYRTLRNFVFCFTDPDILEFEIWKIKKEIKQKTFEMLTGSIIH
jgi:hypothetical protein